MIAHRGVAMGPVPAASPATRRVLRPRQASGARGLPVGGTLSSAAPGTSSRVTRSSAALTQTNPGDSNASPPSAPAARTASWQLRSRSRNKRPLSSDASARSPRAKRARRRSGPYAADSDSQMSNVDQTASPRESRARRNRPKKQSPARARNNRGLRSLAAKTSALCLDSKPVIEDAVIPDWASLPYHVLVPIFQYAAADIDDKAKRAKWLSETSRVCKAFAEPALTALYRAPPLATRAAAHELLSLLLKDKSTTQFDYKQKVKALYIDVDDIASKTYKGQTLDLKSLIANLPRLQVVRFWHWKDLPPYRMLDGSLRWHYPAALFEALGCIQDPAGTAIGAGHPRLIEWQWNRRMMGPNLDLAGITTLHQTPAFANLKRVSFVNYQVPSLHARQNADDTELAAQDRALVESMAAAIGALPNLEVLSAESSTAINDQLLALLPKSLTTLELINCWEVYADDLASYLLSHGHKLQHLVLHHNISLSLGFVTVLRTACPNLRSLCMDFKTFKHHEFLNDSEPNYDELLTAAQVPDWPETLETLELRNMRKWTAEAAETLFQSLVDSASRLLKLRQLVLKAMLDIPYRQRSEFRDRWEPTLKRVFLRKSDDPLPVFSLRQRPAGSSLTGGNEATRSCPLTAKSRKFVSASAMAAKRPSRRSNRIALQLSSPSSPASSMGRDLRHRSRRPSYAEPDTDEDEGGEDGEGSEDEFDSASPGPAESQPASPNALPGETALFRHGMCEKVEIQLDNQKPAEREWRMEDFMDDEADDLSDGDWDGEDEDFGGAGYAW